MFIFITARRDVAVFLNDGKSFFASVFSQQRSLEELSLENESLKKQIELLNFPREKTERYRYKIAQVYSHYPFNDAGLTIIDLGIDDGVRVGMPVVVKEGILLGRIKNAKRTQSEVETIFSPEWKTSVKIGNSGIKAVLNGGPTPNIDLIPVDGDVAFGDEVVNGAPEFPIDSLLGTLSEITKSANDAWKKSSLKLPYKIESLNTVLIIVDFP